MHQSFKHFFIFTLLLTFLYNASGIGVCIEHAAHKNEQATGTKSPKTEKGIVFSQDDNCQCALHMDMNHMLLPEPVMVEMPVDLNSVAEIPHSKAITYRCLLDYFSSRAPPAGDYPAV